jgi:hypothetical protein
MSEAQLVENMENMTRTKWKLRFLSLHANGRMDAFDYAVTTSTDVKAIREKIAEEERYQSDPKWLAGAMKPGTTVRAYHDGYLTGLREALDVILRMSVEVEAQAQAQAQAQALATADALAVREDAETYSTSTSSSSSSPSPSPTSSASHPNNETHPGTATDARQ